MKEITTDILIVGAGMTGLLAALALSETNYKIILIDKQKFKKSYQNDNDFRTTAISEGSKVFFEKINLWSVIKKLAEKISYIKVFDRDKYSDLTFKNHNNEDNYLGYVIKNTLLKKELIKILNSKKNVSLIEDEDLVDIVSLEDSSKFITKKLVILPSLTIVADGKKSTVRSIIKTPIFNKSYKHNALFVNFDHTKNLNNTAYEIFLKSGPLAILPAKSKHSKKYSSSLIWSNNVNFLDSLKNIDNELRKKIIEEKIQKYVGYISKINQFGIFNLSSHLNTRFYEKRLVYLGDAAHSIHPIAGQGWNLGVRDVKNIFNQIKYAEKNGLDIGSKYVCKKYNDNSFYDAYMMYQVTDKLNYIFLNEQRTIINVRKLGFKLIKNTSFLKKTITNYAMGI